MVISTFNEGWEERLARLRRCVAEQPDGPVWLWAIRIRILEFLAARHHRRARQPITELREFLPCVSIDTAPESDNVDTHGPSIPWHTAPLAASDHPPRTREAIHPVLQRLQEVNDDNRMRLDRDAPPQDVYSWWREACCCRRF